MAFDTLLSYSPLLCHFEDLTDVKSHTLTSNNGAAVSSTQSKWGGSSLYLDGTNDYLSLAHSSDFDVTGVDWCIECWVYLSTGSTGGAVIKSGTNGLAANWGLTIDTSRQPQMWVGDTSGSSTMYTYPSAIATDTWTIIKVSRTGNTVQAWKGGSSIGSTTTAVVQTARSGDVVWIGKAHDGSGLFSGYIDDLRVTIGNSRVATNTVVPTEAFPDASSISLSFSVNTNIQPSSLIGLQHNLSFNVNTGLLLDWQIGNSLSLTMEVFLSAKVNSLISIGNIDRTFEASISLAPSFTTAFGSLDLLLEAGLCVRPINKASYSLTTDLLFSPTTTGNYIIDSLYLGFQWKYITTNKTTLKYAFSFEEWLDPSGLTILTRYQFTYNQQVAVENILTYVTSITGVPFEYVESAVDADILFARVDLPYVEVNNFLVIGETSYYVNYYVDSTLHNVISLEMKAYIYIDYNVPSPFIQSDYDNPYAGNAGYHILLHEIGHAMGLKHPFEDVYQLPVGEDTVANTIMSYTYEAPPVYYSTFRPYDLLTLNYIYHGTGIKNYQALDNPNNLILEPKVQAVFINNLSALSGGTAYTITEGFSFGDW